MANDENKSSDTDISRQQLGATYAKALLGASEKAGNSDQVIDELGSLVEDVFDNVDGLESALASPRLSVDEKLGVLDRVFGERMSGDLLTFLKVVCQHGRLDCIRQVYQAARHELNNMRGRVEVRVTTAEQIDSALSDRIAEVLRGALKKDVDLRCEVDAEIVGGLVVRVGDTVYDGSVSNKLARLREETIQKTVQQLREESDRFATSG